jgi:hypothetical protein
MLFVVLCCAVLCGVLQATALTLHPKGSLSKSQLLKPDLLEGGRPAAAAAAAAAAGKG